MRSSGVHRWTSLLVTTLLTLVPTLSSAAAPTVANAPAKNKPKSSTAWIRVGEAREAEGDFAGAGVAYRSALEAMSENKRRANEGAWAAMYSAEAYWMAFERDNDIAHLQAAYAALERWLQLVDPAKPATLQQDVERRMAQLRAVFDELQAGDAALAEGKLEGATKRYDKAREALASQQRSWVTVARTVLRIADTQLAAYDEALKRGEPFELNVERLNNAQRGLVEQRDKRPKDDASNEAKLIEQRLEKIQGLRDEAMRKLAEENKKRADDEKKAEDERLAQEAKDEEARKDAEEQKAEDERRKRTRGITLLATGAVVTAAGAGFLGEGVATGITNQRVADAREKRADEIDREPDREVEREFYTRLQSYRDDSRRYSLGMTVSGVAIATVGLAAVIAGAVILPKTPRTKGQTFRRRAMLTPVVSPSQLGLSFTARFR